MDLKIALAAELVPLPDEQRPAWELAMQTIGSLLAEKVSPHADEEEVNDGEIVEASYETARPV